jgi:ABC-type proline/glycine betaine transport system substrate-binding protein
VRAVLRMVIRAFVMLTVVSLAVAAGAVVVLYAWSPDWLAAAFVLPWWRDSGTGRTDAAREASGRFRLKVAPRRRDPPLAAVQVLSGRRDHHDS